MEIHGFQKLTLLDFPGKMACTVFLGGCNLRCPFCHNALLVTEKDDLQVIPEEEVLSYLEKRKGILDGVAITGGEPLLYPGVEDFMRKVRALGLMVKLDTNGFFPERLKAIVEEGLVDYVAVDIKNAKEKYAETTGIPGLKIEKLEETVTFLLSGPVDYEFRTTVVKEYHDLSDIGKIGKWIEGAEHYYLQNFVDSGNLIGENLHEVDRGLMYAMKEEAAKYVKYIDIRGVD